MPHIQCTIQAGLPMEKKTALADEIVAIVNETIGSPRGYIHVSIIDIPSGQFTESGQVGLDYGKAGRQG